MRFAGYSQLAVRRLLSGIYSLKVRFFPGFKPYRYPAVRKIISWLMKSKIEYLDNVNGHKMYLDDRDSLGLAARSDYEPYETRVLSALIREGDVVLDIGANIGYYTLLFARQVGQSGRVIAFEPDPANFAILKKNVEINNYHNVSLHHAAVSDRSGKTRLYISEHFRSDHRTYDSGDNRAFLEVESCKLDEFPPVQALSPDLVKIDVQGFEYRALLGMWNIISRSPSVILATEFSPVCLQRAGTSPGLFLRMLCEAGFHLLALSEEKSQLRPVAPAELLEAYTVRNEKYTNLLCARDTEGRRLKEALSIL